MEHGENNMYRLVTDNVDILYNSNNLSWNDTSDSLGTQLSFDSIKNLYMHQVVSLYLFDKEIFRGVVINKTERHGGIEYNYVAQDYSYYMNSKTIKQFNKLQADKAINSLISEAYVTGVIDSIPTLITKIYKKSISEIIDDILEQATNDQGIEYIKELESNVLYIRKLQDLKINPSVLIEDGADIKSSTENMKNNIIITDNSEENTRIYATTEDSSKYNWYGKVSETIEIDVDNVAQAKNIANNKLNELNKIEKSSSTTLLVVEEDVNNIIKSNRLIYLNQGNFIGYYMIKSANHSLQDGVHKVNVELEWKVNP